MTDSRAGRNSQISSIPKKSQTSLLLMFFALALIWGGSFIATKIVTVAVPVMQATVWRLLVSYLFIQLIYLIRGIPISVPRQALPAVWISGIMMQAIPFLLFFWGLRYISAGVGGIIESTLPIFVFVFAWLFMKQRESLTTKSMVSLAVGVTGLLLLFADKIEFTGNPGEVLGIVLIILETVAVAIGTIMSRKLLSGKKQLPLPALLYHQSLASLIVVIPIMIAVEGLPSWDSVAISLPVFVGILFLGIFPTATAYYIYALLIREWGSIRAGAVGYLIPVAAFLLDYLFFGNKPTILEISGCLTILAGVAMLQSGGMITTIARTVQQGLRRPFIQGWMVPALLHFRKAA